MSNLDKEVTKAVVHYQECLEKYARREDEVKMLYCIGKLWKLPVTIDHLTETGVGRTVNSLRKIGGEIGDRAKNLVVKWKEMVAKAEETEESEQNDVQPGIANETETTQEDDSYRIEEPTTLTTTKNGRQSRNDTSKHTSRDEDSKQNKKHKDSSTKHKSKTNDKSTKQNDSKKTHKHESDSDSKRKSVKRKHDEKVPKHKHKPDKHRKKYESDTDEQTDDERESSVEEKKIKRKSSSSDKKSKSTSSKDKSKHSSRNSSKSKHSSDKDKSPKKYSSKSKVFNVTNDGIGSGSGTSFAEALGMLEPSSSTKANKKKTVIPPSSLVDSESDDEYSPDQSTTELSLLTNKNLEPLNINIASLLPEITPNYKPLGYSALDVLNRNKINTDDEALSSIMYSKISRTKVYSGNKVAWGKVPSLFEMCTRILQENIDALEFTGGVPYSILKPVLERTNYNQLFTLEQYNPYLLEDTDELWKIHCKRDFRSKSREEMETWRDMYQRCMEEREVKLRALTANIKHSQDKSIPVRQTKLAYVDSVVKPPRNIARKQAKHGTGSSATSANKRPAITPSSRLVDLATAGAAGEVSVPNPGPRAASSTNVIIKPKKAPLMQKTLALMKNRFRR